MADATILDTIIEHKHGEVADRRSRVSLAELQSRLGDTPPTRGFAKALRAPKAIRPSIDGMVDVFEDVEAEERVALIAEVKKASPSAGIIRPDFDPVEIAKIYEANGASCLSVLTDERFFQGHDDYFRAVRKAVSIPMIRKDFTVDAYQIYETRVLGADAILLIVAALTPTQIGDYLGIAAEVGLDALVEVHTEDEMQVAVDAGATLVGINNRDLKRMVTDLATFERLASMAPAGSTLVAESGIKTPADVKRVRRAGAYAILVGESLMRQVDIGAAVRELMG
jgi:indole-3-glycerol phosphate synthase